MTIDLRNNVNLVLQGFMWALRESEGAPQSVDTWRVVKDWTPGQEYDINICGADYSSGAPDNGLIAIVYPSSPSGELGDELFSITTL